MIRDNEKQCSKCGTINNINCKFCSNCGADLNAVSSNSKNIRPGCFASSIFMFILFGFNVLLFIICTLFLWLLGPSVKESFLIILWFLLKAGQVVSILFGISSLVLGIVAAKNTKK
jgi:hypothetical protein